ncbi:MAG: tRNA (N(6)-L-threonylcarbamoyladenosine(37)-C(2))-methylthiotransferase MtaB [Candidatus Izemoplasmatales bacterium]|jgi:threonylcarbamoyladenosine tRNA methylthiotransferase MtaB|nr:tRNA (N(6)-L-threonylcarbamoyladenosine(37)-C(2))-methylthiotransferase MtaB [Candidatus Izemoplasmatales bacterium]
MKVALMTLGCKVNSYETEAVWELMKDRGYQRVDFKEDSDIYIINTCTVTNNGDSKSRKMIREAVTRNSQGIVIVMGCFSQLKADEVLAIPGVKIVLGTQNRALIPDYIDEYRQTKKVVNKVLGLDRHVAFDDLSINAFANHQRAFLKIQDGCNNFCSYCIIPYARGRVRSKLPNQVLSEAKTLVDNNFKEIILTGIHTGGYGQDLPNYRFVNLLRDLEVIKGLERIRISSIEISELTDEVISVISQSHKIVNHLHIPLQSGSDTILQAMNRKYNKQEYADTITKLRSAIPNLAITTDVIVGFPGETEADFAEMVAFIRYINFQELHVFPYSRRSKTVAATMDNQISGEIKKARVQILLHLSDELAKAYIKTNINILLQVIPETYHDGMLKGHTANYIYVQFPGTVNQIGELVDIIITKENYPLSLAKIITKDAIK